MCNYAGCIGIYFSWENLRWEWNETKEIQEEKQESNGWQRFSSPVAVFRVERVQKLPYPALTTSAVSLNR
jgi:hypothetical protein